MWVSIMFWGEKKKVSSHPIEACVIAIFTHYNAKESPSMGFCDFHLHCICDTEILSY